MSADIPNPNRAAGLPDTRLDELLERVARLERILVGRGIATRWDMEHMPACPVPDRRYACEVCKAKPGEACRNTVNPDAPLPGRSSHLARVLPPGRTKPAKEKP